MTTSNEADTVAGARSFNRPSIATWPCAQWPATRNQRPYRKRLRMATVIAEST